MARKLEAQNGVSWKDVGEPTADELAELVRETGLDPADAEFVVQNHQRPEVMPRPNYTLVLVQVPVFDRQARLTRGVPLYLIVGKDWLQTVHFEQIPVLEKIWTEYEEVPEKREEYFSEGALALGLYIVSQMYASAFHKLNRLAKHIDIAEDAVFHGNERKMVEESAILKRDVLDFRKIIRPQRSLFAAVPAELNLSENVTARWQRLHRQVQKLWEVLEGLYESVDELSETNGSLLQHKENELLRLLTYYSAVGLPGLVLLSAVNPANSNTTEAGLWVFWGLLAILVAVLLLIMWRFRGKRVL